MLHQLKKNYLITFIGLCFVQSRKPLIVERDPYTGPVVEVKAEDAQPPSKHYDNPIFPDHTSEFHSRPPTRGGARNMQDSSFSLSGNY